MSLNIYIDNNLHNFYILTAHLLYTDAYVTPFILNEWPQLITSLKSLKLTIQQPTYVNTDINILHSAILLIQKDITLYLPITNVLTHKDVITWIVNVLSNKVLFGNNIASNTSTSQMLTLNTNNPCENATVTNIPIVTNTTVESNKNTIVTVLIVISIVTFSIFFFIKGRHLLYRIFNREKKYNS